MANVNRDKSIEDEPTRPRESAPSQSAQQGIRSSAQLDLNEATEADIAEIDMIGKKLAQAIVAQRAAQGGFRSWDDLARVPGVDPKRIAELQRAARIGGMH